MSDHIDAARSLVAASRSLAAAPEDATAGRRYDAAVAALDALGVPTEWPDLLWWTVAITEARTRTAIAEEERSLLLRSFAGLCEQVPA